MKVLWFALTAPLWAAANDTFLIRNTTVHPVSQPEVKNSSVLVANGRIAAVGDKITAPKGARVIDGKGLHVYPGMIDSGTSLGLAEIPSVRESVDTGELGEFMPQLRAAIAVNAESEYFPVVRANGITTVITLPGSGGRSGGGGFGGGTGDRGVITGQAAMIHLDGWTWEDMAIQRSAAMQLMFPSIQSIPSRFAQFLSPDQQARSSFAEARRQYEERLKRLNEFFENARRYQKAKAAREPGFKADLALEAMVPVLEGKQPVVVSATRERTIREAIQFAEKQHIRIIISGPREFGKTLADLKSKNIPVILGPTLALPQYEDSPYDETFTLPAEVHRAGVKFAFASFNNEFTRNLPYQAANAVAYGLPYEEALKAITLNPAEIWGVGDQLGSVEKGKWADLIVTNGDPLEAPTQVKFVFIKGRQVDLSNKHTRLYEKYINRP